MTTTTYLQQLRCIASKFAAGVSTAETRSELMRELESIGMPTRNLINEPNPNMRLKAITDYAFKR